MRFFTRKLMITLVALFSLGDVAATPQAPANPAVETAQQEPETNPISTPLPGCQHVVTQAPELGPQSNGVQGPEDG